MNDPLVSIIVPTRNSAKLIGRCLTSITNQSYRKIELIVVDNNSTDRTKEIARKYTKKVYNHGPERTFQKNFGTSKAKGEYVLYIDSDMELTKQVVRECVEAIPKDKKIGGVIIPERSVGDSYWVKVRDFERSFYAGTPIESARFFPRKLVREVGGFDKEVVFYEESTLPQKIEQRNYRTNERINAKIFHLEYDFNLKKWLMKKYYYAKSTQKYCISYKKSRAQYSILFRLKLYLTNYRFYLNPLYSYNRRADTHCFSCGRKPVTSFLFYIKRTHLVKSPIFL